MQDNNISIDSMDKTNNMSENIEDVTQEIVEAISFNDNKKSELTNKRIDFNMKTLKRIETMIPVYSDMLPSNASKNDIMALVIAKGIDALFEGDFKRKIDEL